MAEFVVRQLALGSPRAFVISEAHFREISAAAEGLNVIADCEEKFDIVFENFIELEAETARSLLKYMYRSAGTRENFHNLRITFARRVANYLSSGRLYIDHILGDLKRVRHLETARLLREKLDELRQNCEEFTLAEKLRNITQHRSLPVTSLTLGSRWLGVDGDPWKPRHERGYAEYSMQIKVDASVLSHDRRTPEALRNFSGSQDEKLELIPILRKYMDALGVLHEYFRTSTNVEVGKWFSIHEQAIRAYEDLGPPPFPLTPIAESISDTGKHEQVWLLEEKTSRITKLRERNTVLHNVSSRYFTTHINSGKAA